MTRHVMLIALLIGLIGGIAPAAFAGDGGTGTTCDPTTGTCTVTVTDPGSGGQSSAPTSAPTTSDSTGTDPIQTASSPAPSPSRSLVNGACTYQADPSYTPPAGSTTHAGQKGAWYLMTCPDEITSAQIATTTTTVVWLTTPPASTPLPAPGVLAAEAQKKLKLAAPTIESNPAPGRPQLVSVPMWSWLPSSQFTATSATATVPGESVTATATPMSVTWSWGDGTTTTCAGAGTPYTSADSPTASSPTCGHTYSQDSGTGDFTVSATIAWSITWTGGGQAGALGNMNTNATEVVDVEQSRALVTGG
jgi:hypothetical protein